MSPNEARMYELIDDVFDTQNDSTQLRFSESDIEKLNSLSPHTLQEASNEDGPFAWISVFPTSLELMNQFLSEQINERQLFDLTNKEDKNDVVYLCSAIVLPEFRNQGLALKLTIQAVEALQLSYPIRVALVWPFSDSGLRLAEKAAEACGLTLQARTRNT
jgi:ribosomal protein S18 acetylase RimI-like enzyme